MSKDDKQTVARLNQLLDLRDAEFEALEAERDELRRQLEYGVDWMLHTRYLAETDTLPAPRVEMTFKSMTDYDTEAEVVLVLDERGMYRIRVPIGYGKRSGARFRVEEFPTTGEVPGNLYSYLPSVLHDACYQMEKTGLQAYIVIDETRRYKVQTLHPLLLVSVD